MFYLATKIKEDLATQIGSSEEIKHGQDTTKRDLLSEPQSERRTGEKRGLRSPVDDNLTSKQSKIECTNENETKLHQNGEFDPINATKAKKTKVQQLKTN